MAVFAYENKEERIFKGKNLKADSFIKTLDLVHRLEKLFLKIHELSDSEIEEMWPNISETGMPSIGKNNLHIKAKKTDKEFLLSMLMRSRQTTMAIKFTKDNGIDITDKDTQDMLQQKANEMTLRGH